MEEELEVKNTAIDDMRQKYHLESEEQQKSAENKYQELLKILATEQKSSNSKISSMQMSHNEYVKAKEQQVSQLRAEYDKLKR